MPHEGAARRVVTALLAAACVVASGPGVASAGAPSHLDPAFGAGFVTVDLRGTDDSVVTSALRPDGRLVIGATSRRATTGAAGDPAFVQLTAAGQVDTTFSSPDGRTFVVLPQPARLLDLGLAPDGKIVGLAEGTDFGTFYLFRLNLQGSLDTPTDGDAAHFATVGFTTVDFGASVERWQHIAVQADGRTVVAGSLEGSPTSDAEAAMTRYTDAGAVDLDFAGGLMSVSMGVGDALPRDLALSPSGDRAVAAISVEDTPNHQVLGMLVVETATGDPDTSFSDDGQDIRHFGANVPEIDAVTVQTDGRILVATGAPGADALMPTFVRYTVGGALDLTFDGDGVAQPIPSPDGGNDGRFIRVNSTGRIITIATGGTSGVLLARLLPDGAPDASFDGDGIANHVPPFFFDLRLGGGLANAGAIVATGRAALITDDVAALRVTRTGVPDRTFRSGGTLSLPRLDDNRGIGVAVAGNGKLLVAGTDDLSGFDRFLVVRLLPNGYRDPAFGTSGLASAAFEDQAVPADVALSGNQPVVVGCVRCDATSDFALVRFTGAGVPDPAFDEDGQVTTDFGSGLAERANGVAVQTNGRIVVVGHAGDAFGIARYTTSGVLDGTFGGGDGLVTTTFAGGAAVATDVALQSDGRIVVVGRRAAGAGFRFAVARYTTSGALDPTFDVDGKLTTVVGTATSEARGVAIRPDGRIVVAGLARDTGGTAGIGIARYATNGAPDATLDGDGRLVAVLPGAGGVANAVAADGNRIIVAGVRQGRFLVARFRSSGVLDTTLSEDGFEDSAFQGDAEAFDVAIQPADGRIVLVGGALDAGGELDVVAARYLP